MTGEWQRSVRVVADVIHRISPGPFHQVANEQFFFDSLLSLADDGRIEARAAEEDWSMQTSWVRLAPPRD